MKRDIAFDQVPRLALAPVSAGSNAAVVGITIDRKGFQNLLMVFGVGVVAGDIAAALKIQHGDASNASDMDDLDNGGWAVSTTAGADATIYSASFDLSGAKRYVRIHATISGVDSNAALICAWAQLGSKSTPVVAADLTNHSGFFQPYDD